MRQLYLSNLEYLDDLSPLTVMTNLQHLVISSCYNLEDLR